MEFGFGRGRRAGAVRGRRFPARTARPRGSPPRGLPRELRLGLRDAAPDRGRRGGRQTVVIADDQVAGRYDAPADRGGSVHRAPLRRPGAARGDPSREDRDVGPARQGGDIADRAVADHADPAASAQIAAHDLADHRGLGMARGRDDEDVPRLDQIDRVEHGPEIRRFADRRDGPSERPRLPAGRQERPDRGIDRADVPAQTDRHRDGNGAPAVGLGGGEPRGL